MTKINLFPNAPSRDKVRGRADHLDARKTTSFWQKVGIPAIQKIYKNKGSKTSNAEIKKRALNYAN